MNQGDVPVRVHFESCWELIPSGYDIHSSPWKDPPKVNHLFRLGPSIPWRNVSHNQMVINMVQKKDSSPKIPNR